MRFSSIAAVAAAIAPLTVSAKGTLGFCLSARFDNKLCKGQQDYQADFEYLKKQTGSTIFRTYSVLDAPLALSITPSCNVPEAILPAALAAGVEVVIGLWADTEDGYQQEKSALMATLHKNNKLYDAVKFFTVGSEGLYRNQENKENPTANPDKGYIATDILGRINDLKQATGNKKKVGTADSWNKFQDGSADALIKGGVDILLVNAFGYWQSQTISNATATYLDDLQQAFGHIQTVAGSTSSIELWVGETGWPGNGGTDYGAAKAGTDHAQTFWTESVCATLDWNINVFYFEAFNELWKPLSLGANLKDKEDETHWGAFGYTEGGEREQIIPNLSCSYP